MDTNGTGHKSYAVGQAVWLLTPESAPRLHGTRAEILEMTSWGAHVQAPAAETGRFRAHWSEMAPYDPPAANGSHKATTAVALSSFTGDACDACNGVRVLRTGNCKTCQDCGANSGCS